MPRVIIKNISMSSEDFAEIGHAFKVFKTSCQQSGMTVQDFVKRIKQDDAYCNDEIEIEIKPAKYIVSRYGCNNEIPN